MQTWHPITDDEFRRLFAEQYSELNADERRTFGLFSVTPWKAIVRRSEEVGDEEVFVVAVTNTGVLYFDDVEYGFNMSPVDGARRLTAAGGSQNTLKGAVVDWFPRT